MTSPFSSMVPDYGPDLAAATKRITELEKEITELRKVAEDVREQAAKIAASSPDVYCVGIGIAEQIRAMEV
jgi:hypothetical protein